MFFAQNFIKLSTHTCIFFTFWSKKIDASGPEASSMELSGNVIQCIYISFIPDQWPVPSVENHHLIEPEELVQSLSFALYWFPRL